MMSLERKALVALLRNRAGELRFLELAGAGGLGVERLRREVAALRAQLEA
ncbi:MAG TPA: hypothetical protein VFA97_03850 [Gaiellaceae bacterium]|nr:hypothetical protein [Gaiellaceae bacterium]